MRISWAADPEQLREFHHREARVIGCQPTGRQTRGHRFADGAVNHLMFGFEGSLDIRRVIVGVHDLFRAAALAVPKRLDLATHADGEALAATIPGVSRSWVSNGDGTSRRNLLCVKVEGILVTWPMLGEDTDFIDPGMA